MKLVTSFATRQFLITIERKVTMENSTIPVRHISGLVDERQHRSLSNCRAELPSIKCEQLREVGLFWVPTQEFSKASSVEGNTAFSFRLNKGTPPLLDAPPRSEEGPVPPDTPYHPSYIVLTTLHNHPT